jgi:bacteriorhodopsin
MRHMETQRMLTLPQCGSYIDWIVTGPITAIWLGLIAGADTTDIVGAVAGNGTDILCFIQQHRSFIFA